MSESRAGAGKVAEKSSIAFSIEGEGLAMSLDCDASDTVGAVVAKVATAQNRPDLPGMLVSLEDADEPLHAGTEVRDVLRGSRRCRVHLHRCHRVKVSIEYNGKSISDDFPPGSTVHRVLQWAVGKKGFNIEGDVHDLALQLAGTPKALEPHLHIGTLVQPATCTLALELVAKDRPQG